MCPSDLAGRVAAHCLGGDGKQEAAVGWEMLLKGMSLPGEPEDGPSNICPQLWLHVEP